MGGILILIAIIIGCVFIIIFVFKDNKKKIEIKRLLFKDFANRKGLTHTNTKGFMTSLDIVEGTLDNYQFSFYELISGGEVRTYSTIIKFKNTPLDFDFKIEYNHAFKTRSWNRIEQGPVSSKNKRYFVFKSKSEDKFRALFTYNLQNDLKYLVNDSSTSIEAKEGVLTYVYDNQIINKKDFRLVENGIDFVLKLLNSKKESEKRISENEAKPKIEHQVIKKKTGKMLFVLGILLLLIIGGGLIFIRMLGQYE